MNKVQRQQRADATSQASHVFEEVAWQSGFSFARPKEQPSHFECMRRAGFEPNLLSDEMVNVRDGTLLPIPMLKGKMLRDVA
ncbi:hypothetical protein [Reyranella sp.]|uniref:hypothetical protein n=1 Tax=Reyranella sp. TaxID=1929291 RepID=UPI003BA91C18